MAVGEDVLARVELDDLRAQELAVAEHGQPALGLRLAPGDDLGLEGLAELDLAGQQQGLDHHLLLEGQRGRYVPDVGASVLGGLGHRERVAHVLAAVREEHETVGVAGGRRGKRQLQRLRQVGGATADLHLRPVDLAAGLERLIHHRFLAKNDDTRLVSGSRAGSRLRREAEGALAGGQAHAVRDIEQKDDVQTIHPARHGRLGQRQQHADDERAAQAQRPSIAHVVRHVEPPRRLPAPVEEAFERQEKDGRRREEWPELAHDGHG